MALHFPAFLQETAHLIQIAVVQGIELLARMDVSLRSRAGEPLVEKRSRFFSTQAAQQSDSVLALWAAAIASDRFEQGPGRRGLSRHKDLGRLAHAFGFARRRGNQLGDEGLRRSARASEVF